MELISFKFFGECGWKSGGSGGECGEYGTSPYPSPGGSGGECGEYGTSPYPLLDFVNVVGALAGSGGECGEYGTLPYPPGLQVEVGLNPGDLGDIGA